jgi:5-methylcytosine-specific restriction protein A
MPSEVSMPSQPAAYCSGHNRRCPNRATNRGLCDDCGAERRRAYDARRPNANARGYTRTWRVTRADYLSEHPWCECDEHAVLPEWQRPAATDVDHIDGLGPAGPRGHDWDNLRSMTHECHSKRTARDQAGGWAKRT